MRMKTVLSIGLVSAWLMVVAASAEALETSGPDATMKKGMAMPSAQVMPPVEKPDVLALFFSREKNPMVQFVVTMSENCPLDFVGLGRDLGEVVGLVEPPQLKIPEHGSFAERMQALQASKDATKSVWKRMISRSCLLNKLFGDGSCNK